MAPSMMPVRSMKRFPNLRCNKRALSITYQKRGCSRRWNYRRSPALALAPGAGALKAVPGIAAAEHILTQAGGGRLR
jgi:hypothetical protein